MKLDTYLTHDPAARIVGWPFRMLGALLVLACIGALAVCLYGAFVDHRVGFAIFTLALLPTGALIVRTVGLIALTGRVPAVPLWPFPSGGAAATWIVISGAIIQLYAANA